MFAWLLKQTGGSDSAAAGSSANMAIAGPETPRDRLDCPNFTPFFSLHDNHFGEGEYVKSERAIRALPEKMVPLGWTIARYA
jgi:hypothetical protein